MILKESGEYSKLISSLELKISDFTGTLLHLPVSVFTVHHMKVAIAGLT